MTRAPVARMASNTLKVAMVFCSRSLRGCSSPNRTSALAAMSRHGEGDGRAGPQRGSEYQEECAAREAVEAVQHDDDDFEATPENDLRRHHHNEDRAGHLAREDRQMNGRGGERDQRQRGKRPAEEPRAIDAEQATLHGRDAIERGHEAEGEQARQQDAHGRSGGEQAEIGQRQRIGDRHEIGKRDDEAPGRAGDQGEIGPDGLVVTVEILEP